MTRPENCALRAVRQGPRPAGILTGTRGAGVGEPAKITIPGSTDNSMEPAPPRVKDRRAATRKGGRPAADQPLERGTHGTWAAWWALLDLDTGTGGLQGLLRLVRGLLVDLL